MPGSHSSATLQDSNPSFCQQGSLFAEIGFAISTNRNLVSLLVTRNSGHWGDIVLNWAPPVLRVVSAVDIPARDFHAFVSLLQQPNILSIPLDPSTTTSYLGQIERLILPPFIHYSSSTASKSVIGILLLGFLPYFRNLRKLTLSFDDSIDFTQVLRFASALPFFNDLTFNRTNVDIFHLSRSIPAIVEGLYGFDHLRRLCITRDALFTSVHQCLGSLQGLKEIKIIATSDVHIRLNEPGVREFPVLQTLEVVGSFSILVWALRAFTNPAAQRLHKLKVLVKAESIFKKSSMIHALSTMALRCFSIQHLSIRIEGSVDREILDWKALAPLSRLDLKTFVIRHPRPLLLLDVHIRNLLRSWPRVRFISLNPSPSGNIHHWRLPTLESLVHVAKYGHSLRHFELHLKGVNRSAIRLAVYHGIERRLLREFDFGTSNIDAQATSVIQRLFPRAYISYESRPPALLLSL